jgi:hypothetical protein
MGPPAAPLAIAVIASRCSALALSSAMSPTDQLPFAISSGEGQHDESQAVEGHRPACPGGNLKRH